jgi:hypothetical protein
MTQPDHIENYIRTIPTIQTPIYTSSNTSPKHTRVDKQYTNRVIHITQEQTQTHRHHIHNPSQSHPPPRQPAGRIAHTSDSHAVNPPPVYRTHREVKRKTTTHVRDENQEHVRLYDFMYNHANDVNQVAFSHDENLLLHVLGRISDVKGLHNQHSTVRRSQNETPTIDQDNPPALHSQSATLKPNQNNKTKMARSPTQHVRRTTRRQYDRQEQNLKELQIRILQKLHHIQHFNICNNAPVTTVSMALYRRGMALDVRDHINTATACITGSRTTRTSGRISFPSLSRDVYILPRRGIHTARRFDLTRL